jgi:hypothetical protein
MLNNRVNGGTLRQCARNYEELENRERKRWRLENRKKGGALMLEKKEKGRRINARKWGKGRRIK